MEQHLSTMCFSYHPTEELHLSLQHARLILFALCGYTPQETATQMNLTLDTVYTYRRRIAKKLRADTFEGVLGLTIFKGVFTRAEHGVNGEAAK